MSTSKVTSILILGGNPETASIVEVARGMGLRTVISNPFPNSPAKVISDKAFDVDPKDEDAIHQIICSEDIKGIVMGVSDPLLPTYEKLCSKYKFTCYAQKKTVEAFSSKATFARLIKEFGIETIPQFGVVKSKEQMLSKIEFPAVTKPVDAGAATGVSLCRTRAELEDGIRVALDSSMKKEVVIEKAMYCDDLMAYYTFRNGKVFLTGLADRFKSKVRGDLPKVCLMAQYPSKHTHMFLSEVHPKLVQMFEHLEIRNGVLSIQFFYDGSIFYGYDPGFRLQGEAPHIYVKALFGADQRKGLIDFALGTPFLDGEFEETVDVYFKGKFARTLWVLGRPGVLTEVYGVKEIQKQEGILSIQQRFKEGEEITEDMMGTERQVLMRIHTLASSVNALDEITKFVSSHLKIQDKDGVSLIEDQFTVGTRISN